MQAPFGEGVSEWPPPPAIGRRPPSPATLQCWRCRFHAWIITDISSPKTTQSRPRDHITTTFLKPQDSFLGRGSTTAQPQRAAQLYDRRALSSQPCGATHRYTGSPDLTDSATPPPCISEIPAPSFRFFSRSAGRLIPSHVCCMPADVLADLGPSRH
jgi:hypothetical protein